MNEAPRRIKKSAAKWIWDGSFTIQPSMMTQLSGDNSMQDYGKKNGGSLRENLECRVMNAAFDFAQARKCRMEFNWENCRWW